MQTRGFNWKALVEDLKDEAGKDKGEGSGRVEADVDKGRGVKKKKGATYQL